MTGAKAGHGTVLAWVFLCCAWIAWHAVPARAESLRPGIIGSDDRVRVEPTGTPWSAVGQVNIAGYRRVGACTGTLVAPDLVLTAAHCVMNPWKREPYPSHDIHFLAGVSGARNQGHATAKCLRFLDGYQPTPQPPTALASAARGVSPRAFSQDIVVITLKQPLSVPPAPLAEDPNVTPGLALIHAAYPGDRRHALMVHSGCRVLGPLRNDGLWLTDCDSHPGSSGGPVFVTGDGVASRAPGLAGVLVGLIVGRASVVVPITVWREILRKPGCDAAPRPAP